MKHKENWLHSPVLELLAENDIQGLAKILNSPEYDIVTRRHAVIALGETGDKEAINPLIEALNHEDGGVRRAVSPALGNFGLSAVEPLINVLRDMDDDKYVEWMAKSAFRCIGDPVNKRLSESLEDKNPLLRKNAALVLGIINDKSAVTTLIDVLKDESAEVRSSAAYALGKISDSDAVEPLMIALDDNAEEVRSAAITALGEIGDSRAVDALIEMLDDESMIDFEAIAALGKIGDKRVVKPLQKKLKGLDKLTRMAIENALKDIGDERH